MPLTDIYMSPEALEEIRNWRVDLRTYNSLTHFRYVEFPKEIAYELDREHFEEIKEDIKETGFRV